MNNQTKDAMSSALVSLLKKNPISKITVFDITNKCHVNRQTFYYHFNDIYELLEYTLDCQVKKRIDNKEFEKYNVQEAANYFRNVVEEQRIYVLNAYDSRNHAYYEQIIKKQFYPSIYKMITNIDESKYVKENNLEFIANALTKIIVGLFMDWIANGAPDNDLNDWDRLQLIFNDESLKNILLRFAKV